MADPGRAADHAAANTGGTGANPYPETAGSAGLAYSRGHDLPDLQGIPVDDIADDRDFDDEPVVDQPWGLAWSRAAAVLLVCLGVAVVILVANYALRPNTAESGPDTAAPVPSSARAATTTTIASTPDQDERYIAALTDHGLEFRNPQDVIVGNGKAVCQSFAANQTAQQIVDQFKSVNPKLAEHANDFVAISVRTYCPEYNVLVAGLA